jgi:polyhydroxyalkanoate synthesis regulator phasin
MPEPITPPASDPAPSTPDPPAPATGDPPAKLTADQKREAARFEKLTGELKTATTERDQLRERVNAYHRRSAEAMAGKLAVPKDLWDVGGVTVDELLTDGEMDKEKVQRRVDKLIEARPGLAAPPAQPRPRGLPGPGAQPPIPTGGAPAETFAGLLREKGVR